MNSDETLKLWSSLLIDGRDILPTKAVLHELSEYSGKSIDEVRQLASTAPSITSKKWVDSDRSTPEGLSDFYNSVSNWVFGTLSYHARQAESENVPLPVQVAAAVSNGPPGDMLDFGCGVATACLLFAQMGWRVAAADISVPLLEFAKWRFRKRDIDAQCIDLNTEQLGSERFDLITAFNTMAHVSKVDETLQTLRTALRTGGKLIFDIDARKRGHGNDWHLYEDHYFINRRVRRSGFIRLPSIGFMYVYERREISPLKKLQFDLFDGVRYGTFTRWLINKARTLQRRLNSKRKSWGAEA